jgi:hypothetical protein
MPYKLVHGTSYANLGRIVATGAITARPKDSNDRMVEDNRGAIFAQVLSSDFQPREEHTVMHWREVALVLKPQVLKDHCFVSTCIGCFDRKGKKMVYDSGNGNLKRLPMLKRTRDVVREYTTHTSMPEKIAFMHSHELLIYGDIPLSYVDRVLVQDPGSPSSAKRFVTAAFA